MKGPVPATSPIQYTHRALSQQCASYAVHMKGSVPATSPIQYTHRALSQQSASYTVHMKGPVPAMCLLYRTHEGPCRGFIKGQPPGKLTVCEYNFARLLIRSQPTFYQKTIPKLTILPRCNNLLPNCSKS